MVYVTWSAQRLNIPKKLALAFLEELISGFQDEIKKTWGTGESLKNLITLTSLVDLSRGKNKRI